MIISQVQFQVFGFMLGVINSKRCSGIVVINIRDFQFPKSLGKDSRDPEIGKMDHA